MNWDSLKTIMPDQPPYRLRQVKEAVFKKLVEDWSEVTVLPLNLREKLNQKVPLAISARTLVAQDGQIVKALITLRDGGKIESVLMRHQGERRTVCVSSQIGCPLGCVFCATGKMGFKRNLNREEIIDQVLFFARFLKKNYQPPEKVTNLVFMGMGEPFLNYDQVLGAIKILNDPEGFSLGARRFSISTVGIIDGIEKLGQEKLQINLAISLHAPNNQLRSRLMPINEKYPLEIIFRSVDSYIKRTRRRVMFEYLLIKDVNDSDGCAKKLVSLMKKPLYFVNLITYNPTGIFKPSLPNQVKRFKEILINGGVAVTQRYRFGQEVKAACGQLATG